jgi:exopolyphosphatase/guanosine-5'-triphosphate,3'-diphosphate pyrophosphatase
VAGTITTLACLVLDLASYDSGAIHLRVFTRKQMEVQIDTLANLDPETRAALPCMQEGRARVIVAGGEILLGAMEALCWEEITVSERDMLDGILLEDDTA